MLLVAAAVLWVRSLAAVPSVPGPEPDQGAGSGGVSLLTSRNRLSWAAVCRGADKAALLAAAGAAPSRPVYGA